MTLTFTGILKHSGTITLTSVIKLKIRIMMTVEEQTAKDIDDLRQEVVSLKENSHRREKILESALEFYSARLHQDPECRSNRGKSSFKTVQWVEDGLIAKNALKDYRRLKAKG